MTRGAMWSDAAFFASLQMLAPGPEDVLTCCPLIYRIIFKLMAVITIAINTDHIPIRSALPAPRIRSFTITASRIGVHPAAKKMKHIW